MIYSWENSSSIALYIAYFLANTIMLGFPILTQLVKFNSRSFWTHTPSVKALIPKSLILIQSARFNTLKFLQAAIHFKLASLILSQSVIDTYLSSMQFLVSSLMDVSVIFLFEAIFIFLSSVAWLKYWNESSVKCGESKITISVSLFKRSHSY